MPRRPIEIRVLVGLAVLWLLPALATGAPPSPAGMVQQVAGRVVLTRDATSSPITVNQEIFPGDRLVADGKATAVIRLDQHLLRMGPGSTLLLTQADQAAQNYSVFLWAGRIWLYVVKGLAVLNFEVETPAAVAGVRGTLFSVEVATDGTTWVGVAEGRVAVRSLDGGSKVELPPNYGTVVKPGGQPEKPKKLKPGQVGGENLKLKKDKEKDKKDKDKKDKEK